MILASRFAPLSQPHLQLWACVLLAALVAMRVAEPLGTRQRRYTSAVVSLLLAACALADLVGPGLCSLAERLADAMR